MVRIRCICFEVRVVMGVSSFCFRLGSFRKVFIENIYLGFKEILISFFGFAFFAIVNGVILNCLSFVVELFISLLDFLDEMRIRNWGIFFLIRFFSGFLKIFFDTYFRVFLMLICFLFLGRSRFIAFCILFLLEWVFSRNFILGFSLNWIIVIRVVLKFIFR